MYEEALSILTQIGVLLDGIDASLMQRGGGGADIGPLMKEGVPGLGLRTVGEHYFDWHHSAADTLDKVDPVNFRKAVATLGVTSYILADMPGRFLHFLMQKLTLAQVPKTVLKRYLSTENLEMKPSHMSWIPVIKVLCTLSRFSNITRIQPTWQIS